MGQKKCKSCDGSGASLEEDKKGQRKLCPSCDGSGRVSSGKQKEDW